MIAEGMIRDENGSRERSSATANASATHNSQIASHHANSKIDHQEMLHHHKPASDRSYAHNVIEHPCLLKIGNARLMPPITKISLSELDLENLLNNLLLRHDLNFDPKIQYRPSTYGAQGERRMTAAVEYWNAMGTELFGHLAGRGSSSACGFSGCQCSLRARSQPTSQASHKQKLIRLPRMFETLREILKSLLPPDEWPAIDAWLDIDLLVQEVESNACDFRGLVEWLGSLLKRFCFAARHDLLHNMTSRMRGGVENQDTAEILNGLMQMFSILEVMKLVRMFPCVQWRHNV